MYIYVYIVIIKLFYFAALKNKNVFDQKAPYCLISSYSTCWTILLKLYLLAASISPEPERRSRSRSRSRRKDSDKEVDSTNKTENVNNVLPLSTDSSNVSSSKPAALATPDGDTKQLANNKSVVGSPARYARPKQADNSPAKHSVASQKLANGKMSNGTSIEKKSKSNIMSKSDVISNSPKRAVHKTTSTEFRSATPPYSHSPKRMSLKSSESGSPRREMRKTVMTQSADSVVAKSFSLPRKV